MPSAKQETQSTKEEMQPTMQETQSMQQKKHSSDIGYKLFMEYYHKLTDMPSLVDLMPHFIAANIISSSDGEVITSSVTTKSQTDTLMKLLVKIMAVCHSDNKPFRKMLGIMQTHGDSAAKALGAVMIDKFLELFPSPSTGTHIYKASYVAAVYSYKYILLCFKINM